MAKVSADVNPRVSTPAPLETGENCLLMTPGSAETRGRPPAVIREGLTKQLVYPALLAPGTALRSGAIAAGAPLNVTTGWQPMLWPPRTIRLVHGMNGVACTVTITVKRFSKFGDSNVVLTQALTQGDGASPKIYDILTCAADEIVSLTSPDPGDTLTVQTGPGIGLPERAHYIHAIAVDEVLVALGSCTYNRENATLTVPQAKWPDGAKKFEIVYNPLLRY